MIPLIYKLKSAVKSKSLIVVGMAMCTGVQAGYTKSALDTQIEADLKRGAQAAAKQNNKDAEKYFAAAVNSLDVARRNDLSLASALISLGHAQYAQSNYKAAEGVYKRALEIEQKSLPTSSPELASTLRSLADTEFNLNRFELAEQHYRQALPTLEKSSDENLGWVYKNLAMAAKQNRKLGDSKDFYIKALKIQEAKNPKDAAYAQAICDVGAACQQMQQYEHSEEYGKKSLAVFEQAVGADSPKLLDVFQLLGSSYYGQKKFGLAQQYFEKAAKIQEKQPESLDFSWTLQNLAVTCAERKNISASEAAFKRALAIRRKLAGNSSQPVLETLDGYAWMLRYKANRPEEADKLYAQANTIRKETVKH